MKCWLRLSMALALSCCVVNTARAQESPSRARVWAAVGMGAAAPTSGGDAITNMAQLVYQKGSNHFALRGVALHDLQGETNTTSTDLIGEVGLLYGRTRELSWGRAALAAGISGIAFDACPDDDDSCFTAGIPIVAEVARSGRAVGIGVQGFGNINTKASYAGAVLFVQVGRLR
jgi:hypothetical protein